MALLHGIRILIPSKKTIFFLKIHGNEFTIKNNCQNVIKSEYDVNRLLKRF